MKHIDETYTAQEFKEHLKLYGTLPANVIEFLIEKYEVYSEVIDSIKSEVDEVKAGVQSEDILQPIKDALFEAKDAFPSKVKDKASLTFIENAISELDSIEQQIRQDSEYQLEKLKSLEAVCYVEFKKFEPASPFYVHFETGY